MSPSLGAREFNLSRLERVASGPGAVETLGRELEQRGLERAVVVTGRTLGGSALLTRVTDAAGKRCVAVFKASRQHVPRGVVGEIQALVRRVDADALVSFGGGSPIDACKVAIHASLDVRTTVHIAIPTTLSAAEYTHSAGVTDEATLVKSGVSDPRLQPKVVIQDPTLASDTPDWLWAATGVRALDHAIESIYAVRHHPLSDTLGAKAIAMLVRHLPASIASPDEARLEERAHCQTAAWFSIFGSMNTRFGLSHLLGHQIGPRFGVAHGVTSCITLPHAMRFMAEIAPERFGPIAEGFGVPFSYDEPKRGALECADRTRDFIARFDVPHSLREAGVGREEVAQIVGTVQHELERSGVVDRLVTDGELAALLHAAY